MDTPLVDPNLNADIYRNMTAADRPPVSDMNLQFIAVNDEKHVILGGSNMTDRYWSGTLWYFDDATDFNRGKALVATKTESGICDGAFFERDKFLLGEDTGVLQVISLVNVADTNIKELQCLGYACQHDDSLLSLSVFSNNTHVVTAGMDFCIKVWDIAEMITTHSLSFAHAGIITNVDVQPRSSSNFVSVSLDSEALMWDVRQPKPAQSIYSGKFGLTAINWNTILDHIVAIGSANGNVTLVDIRKTGASVLHESRVFSRGVHKLLFNPNPERSEELACCCDDTLVKVLDVNKDLSVVYENEKHTDFVRGLAWCKDELFSCSWDNNVIKHLLERPINNAESS